MVAEKAISAEMWNQYLWEMRMQQTETNPKQIYAWANVLRASWTDTAD